MRFANDIIQYEPTTPKEGSRTDGYNELGRSPGRSGYIYNQGNGGWITPEENLVRNSLMINGEWNKVRVLAVGQRIQTWINGRQVSDLTVPGEIHER